MNEILRGIDRSGLVKGVAVYLVIYAILNVCGGLALTITGVLGVGGAAVLQQSGVTALEGGSEAAAAATAAATFGGLAVVWGILALISVPLFLIVAYGLFQRKTWARMGAVVALGATILLSLLNFGSGGIGNLLWIVVSGFVLYMFLTDEGIRQELSR